MRRGGEKNVRGEEKEGGRGVEGREQRGEGKEGGNTSSESGKTGRRSYRAVMKLHVQQRVG